MGRRVRGVAFWLVTQLSRRACFVASQEASRDALQKSGVFGAGVPLVTEITAASTFWCAQQQDHLYAPTLRDADAQHECRPAEVYHQDYYMKKSQRYKVYRYASGRDAYIESVWGTSAHSEASQQM